MAVVVVGGGCCVLLCDVGRSLRRLHMTCFVVGVAEGGLRLLHRCRQPAVGLCGLRCVGGCLLGHSCGERLCQYGLLHHA